MRTILLSCRPGPFRSDAVATLLGSAGPVTVVSGPDALVATPEDDLVVVDGQVPPRSGAELRALEEWVRAGGTVLAIGAAPAEAGGFWADLLGTVAQPAPPPGEYALALDDDGSGVTARLPRETLVWDGLAPFEPASDLVVLAHVSVRFTDRPVLAHRRVGAGRVVLSGVGVTDAALAHPVVTALLRRATAAPDEAPTRRTFGLAVVGYGPYGGMGQYHGTAASTVPGLALVAAVDPSSDRRKAAESDFPGIRAYETVDELIRDDAAEVVVVATPPVAHASLALQLLRAGRHVVCEKPMCLTVAEADELLATAAAGGLTLTVNQNRRWDPDFVALRRAVDDGLLGDVFNVETFVGGFEHPCRAWHSEVAVSGGAVYDWGSHHVDWILQLFGGPPERITCHGHKRVWHDVTNLDQLRLRMVWADGREAEFFQSDVAAVRKPKFYVQGTAGTLVGHYRPLRFERVETGRGYVLDEAHHAEAPADLSLARYEGTFGLTRTELPVAPEQRFAFHRNLADHLVLGEPLAVDPVGVRDVVAVLEAAQRSSDAGGVEIRIP